MQVVLSVPDDGLALFPLLDRPFVQHVVEVLAGRDLREIHFILGPRGRGVEPGLGDGRRWGGTFHYHLAPDSGRPAGPLAAVAATVGRGRVLLGQVDRLPLLPDPLPRSRTLLDAAGAWTGWAVADAGDLTALPRSVTWAGLEGVLAGRQADRAAVGRILSLRTPADVPGACRLLLRSEFPGVLTSGRGLAPATRVGPRASVSPGAVLRPPVYIGEGTVVRSDAHVGPNAVIGPGCLIDTAATVRDSVVLARTHVGPGVELDGAIADRGHLIGPEASDIIEVDSNLLGELPSEFRVGPSLGRVAERFLAGVVLLLGLPVLAATAVWLWFTRPGPVFWARRFVCPGGAGEGVAYTLAAPDLVADDVGWLVEPSWRGLVQELLPALPAVVAGRLRLVGLPPRGPELFRAIEPPLAEVGLISEAGLIGPTGLSASDVRTLDAYQAEVSTVTADLGRLARFLARVLAGRGEPEFTPTPAAV